jgi:hypothetical protein
MSISTTISGLLTKHQDSVRPTLASIVANVALGVNQIIEGATNMTFTEKAQMRADMKTLCTRAFRPPLGIVDRDGEVIDAGKLD